METILLILIGVLSRVMPHAPNMTAIGALAVFSGAKLPKARALIVVFAIMLLSDMVFGFHSTMWATYGSLALAVYLGAYLTSHKGFLNTAGILLASSVIFYLVTNFAVWAVPGSMYPKTFSGLLQSYIMALPFFRNSLVGDFVYAGIFFGAYELVRLKSTWNKTVVE